MQPKEVTIGAEARTKIKAGIDKAVKAVAPTLGAVGMSAIIESKGLMPLVSDDGITILKHLQFKDPYEQIGLELIRDAALRTSREGGDGTATTTVLTGAIVDATFRELGGDTSKCLAIKRRLQQGLEEALGELSKLKREVDGNIEQIATISSLDPEVAGIIAKIIGEVGIHGVVTVEKGSKLGYSSEVVKGVRFDKGLISPFFITDPERQEAVLENPYIVLVDRKISTNEQILSILNSIGTGNEILFIADDVDSVALGTLAHNAVNKIAKIACVRNPYTGQRAQDFLFDIAALTGATVVSEQRGMKLSEATKQVCGRADKVIVSRDYTTIVGGQDNEALKSRIAAIEKQIEEMTSEYEKQNLKDRLASLTGGIGVIRVGTYTDTDFQTKKQKFDNAINATQAALQEGILPGGGTALARVAYKMTDPIFQKALRVPLIQQGINANMKPNRWWKPSWQKGGTNFIKKVPMPDVGFNFKTRQLEPLFLSGIIDPFKVTRLALESAVAIASQLVSGETVIVDEQ